MISIEVKLTFNFLAWTLHFVEPIIEMNNVSNKKSWGNHFFNLNPGKHSLKVYFSYNGQNKRAYKEICFDITDGECIKICYYVFPFLQPRIKLIKQKEPYQ